MQSPKVKSLPAEVIDRARDLRQASPHAERLLWTQLRSRRLGGLKFRRQVPVGSSFVDFLCAERALVVELDGGQHAEGEARRYDAARTLCVEQQGRRVLRFWNHELMLETDVVLNQIWETPMSAPSPRSSPASGRGRRRPDPA